MNGLKFIRTQCNLSLNNVAQALNVSRQIISAWENGKKDIPDERKKQLSDYFGEYYGSNVPLFRRNGYRQSGAMIP